MIYLLFSFFPIGIVLILIILYNIEGRIINFYNKNLNYFISTKYKVNIKINKKIKRWKIEAIIINLDKKIRLIINVMSFFIIFKKRGI